MILNDNNVLNILKETNLLKETNYYFSGAVTPTFKEYVLFGNFAYALKDFSGYIVNYTNEGIGIVPLDTMSNKPLTELACFIEKSNIERVEISKGGLFFYKKITIITKENEAISFKVMKNVLVLKKHKENLQKFIDAYQN